MPGCRMEKDGPSRRSPVSEPGSLPILPGTLQRGARETDVHLYLKAQCLVGARAAGWDALPEQSGRICRKNLFQSFS